MARLELTADSLVVHIEGADKFWALATRLEVPLAHVASVETRPADARQVWHGLRMGGTNLPGVVTAGRFLQHGEWAFWDVHDPDRAIAIRLHDDRYARLVIGVEDPDVAAELVRAAIGRMPG